MTEVPWDSMTIRRRDGGRAMIAKFDLADAKTIKQYTWHLQTDGSSGTYAETIIYAGHKKSGRTHIYMHQLVLQGLGRIDHLNGNGMDNRRANLRFATQSQILAKRKPGGGVSKFKGVCWDDSGRSSGMWMARFRGKNLGRFAVEEDAARAFDDAAFEYWGHQAYFNFPDEVADWEWTPPPGREDEA
jgi:hypothetical protein